MQEITGLITGGLKNQRTLANNLQESNFISINKNDLCTT